MLYSRASLPLRRPGQRPLGLCTIQRNDPLTQGMIGAWIPGVMGGIDLTGTCSPMTLTQLSGAVGPIGVGSEGPVLTGAVSTTGGNILSCLSPPQFKNWNNFSLYYRGPRGTGQGASSTCPLLYVAYSSGINNPFDVVGIGDFNGNDLTSVSTGWNDGSAERKGTGVNLSTKALFSVLGAFTVGGNNLLYSDGVQVASNSWVGSTQAATSSTDTININGWVATARATPTLCSVAYAWNRTLTAAEAVLLDRDPWRPIASRMAQLSMVGAAAVGGSFIPAWAMNSNLPIIGTGTY